MAKITFENLTVDQVKDFAQWFEWQGQVDAREWFKVRNLKCPQTDHLHKGGAIQCRKYGDVVVYCRSEN